MHASDCLPVHREAGTGADEEHEVKISLSKDDANSLHSHHANRGGPAEGLLSFILAHFQLYIDMVHLMLLHQ